MQENNNLKLLIHEVESKAKIEEVISQYVALEKKGNNYVGVCPFHQDKNPSMSVSPQKKIFKCFSCGASGGVISFVQNFEGISFIDALKKIASSVNVEWKGIINTKEKVVDQLSLDIFKLNQDAKNFFKFKLENSLEHNPELKDYLKKRQLNDELLIHFEIGFVEKGEELINFLIKKNYSEELIVKAGIARLENGKIHSIFVNRLMFPIKNNDGNIIGFSGRIIVNNDKYVKYLNSPETHVFKKGNFLYNFSSARSDISLRGSVLVVEGYMDVIAFYKMGIKNTIALMGTAFSETQLKTLKSVTKKATLALDNDRAGFEATQKIGQQLESNEFIVKVFQIKEGKDIDEYIKVSKISPDDLDDQISNSVELIEFVVNKFIETNTDKPNFTELSNLVKLIANTKDNLKKDWFINLISNKYSIDRNTLTKELRKNSKQEDSDIDVKLAEPKNVSNKFIKNLDKVQYSPSFYNEKETRVHVFDEKTILRYTMYQKNLFKKLLDSAYDFFDEKNKIVMNILRKYYRTTNAETLNNYIFEINDLNSDDFDEISRNIELRQRIKEIQELSIKDDDKVEDRINQTIEKLLDNHNELKSRAIKKRIAELKDPLGAEKEEYLFLIAQQIQLAKK